MGVQDQIKANLTGLMLSTPPAVRSQLAEALAVISSHDFPARWPGLLPDLISKMQGASPAVLAGLLETANSIFKRYRGQYMTPQLVGRSARHRSAARRHCMCCPWP